MTIEECRNRFRQFDKCMINTSRLCVRVDVFARRTTNKTTIDVGFLEKDNRHCFDDRQNDGRIPGARSAFRAHARDE